MKPQILLLVAVMAWVGMQSVKWVEPILTKLGMDSATAQNYIMANFTGSFSSDYDVRDDFINTPRLKALASIVQGDKVGAALELCEYIKKYCNSQEFADRYQKKRADSKPGSEPPQMDEETIENMRQNVKELESALAELKKSPKQNAQAITAYEPMLTAQKATLAEWEDPTPNKTKWERNYPADPAVLVRRKLEDYLQLLKTVDFNARLTAPDAYNIQKFSNPEYESKPAQWKACYRAGKEVNEEVKAFVEDWLKGEVISSAKTRMAEAEPQAVQPAKGVVSEAHTGSGAAPAAGVSQNEASTDGTDSLVTAAKAKKSLFSKVKSAAKKVIKD